MDHLWQDIRSAARQLRRYPIAATVAITSLAAGIGATTVTLTIRDAIFRKPPPLYERPEHLSRIQVGRPDRPIHAAGSPVPGSLYAGWSRSTDTKMAASMALRGPRDVRTDDRLETLPVRAATDGLFALLGIRAELGTLSLNRATDPTAAVPAVLSFRLWHRLFDAAPDVLGRTIWIDNAPHTIVGVLPARFWFSDMGSPVWVPLDPARLTDLDAVEVIVRRPDGVTHAMLDAQLQTGLADYASRLPVDERQLRLRVAGVEGTPIGHQVAVFLPYVLAASVLLTLLIACANVAILMIAQWTTREHEIAIRASIGASRARIARSLVAESVSIALFGGILGLCATLALRAWVLSRAGEASFFDLSMGAHIFIKTALIAFATGIAAGLGPALYETRRLHTNPLRTLASSDRVRQRWRHALVVIEITVTVALLVQTTAMIDGFQRARSPRMGFATAPLMNARVENSRGVPVRQLLDRVRSLPGVDAAAVSTRVAYYMDRPETRVAADPAGEAYVLANRTKISGDFFKTLDVPMRAGRAFSDRDTATLRIAIVNETLARQLYTGRNPVGRQIWFDKSSFEIVGVVADYFNNPLQYPETDPKVFLPLGLGERDVRRVEVIVRASGDPAPLVQTIRREVRDLTPGTTVTGAVTFDQILRVMSEEILVGTAPLFPLIMVGMLLTMAGIYGVLSFAVTRRARELAIRIAIGASGRDLVRLVSGQAVRLVATGVVLGITLTFGLAKVLSTYGGGGSIFDPQPRVFLIPGLVVVVISGLATWIPSRRARKIDPAVLLRA